MLTFCLSFIYMSFLLRSLCPFKFYSHLLQAVIVRKLNDYVPSAIVDIHTVSAAFLVLNSYLCMLAPTTVSHQKFCFYYIVGRATIWPTLCITVILESMIMFLLCRDNKFKFKTRDIILTSTNLNNCQ
jgi:hypothetical protein